MKSSDLLDSLRSVALLPPFSELSYRLDGSEYHAFDVRQEVNQAGIAIIKCEDGILEIPLRVDPFDVEAKLMRIESAQLHELPNAGLMATLTDWLLTQQQNIQGIFDHLSPEQFHASSSTVPQAV